jgi:hypothetical protein
MHALKPIAGFALRVVVVYGVLAVPWSGIRNAYGALYRTAADLGFGPFFDGRLRFEPIPSAEDGKDTRIRLRDHINPATRLSLPHDSRLTAYLPTIELIALVLATPVSWSRRGVALAWGLLAMHAFIALRIAVILAYMHHHADLGWTGRTARLFQELLAVAPTPGFIVPVIIWAAVMLRRDEVMALVRRASGGAAPAATPLSEGDESSPRRRRR